ncbi:MAG: monovalent cation/H+ antiporter subunit D [Myxococcota bacterium]
MNHLPVCMVLLPMFTAVMCLWLGEATRSPFTQRWTGLLGMSLLLGLSVWMLSLSADGQVFVYRLGNWPAPFAITLVVDRLSATMVALTVVLALVVLLAAWGGDDTRGPYFHPLVHLQVMGLCGAFMTGDLFNLFVFFEILLIASYALLVYGGGPARVRATLHYVVLNLVGSALFLLSVGLLYGTLGTLNMADMAAKVATATSADVPLIRAAAGLLLVVFGLKAAIVPMSLWLPSTYEAATTPVSAFFAIMTKVGIYGIIRVFIPLFGPEQPGVGGVAEPWVGGLGLVTLLVGTLGTLAATDLKNTVSFLIVVSVGLQAISLGQFTEAGLAAAIFYIVHSTFLTAGLFLMAGAIIHQRGELGGRLSAGPVVHQGRALAVLFLIAAMSVVGLPPLSGFISKALILSATPSEMRPAVWGIILSTSFLLLVQLARVGSVLFWNVLAREPKGCPPGPNASLGPAIFLMSASLLIALFAGPIDAFTREAAASVYDRETMIERVLRSRSDSKAPNGLSEGGDARVRRPGEEDTP